MGKVNCPPSATQALVSDVIDGAEHHTLIFLEWGVVLLAYHEDTAYDQNEQKRYLPNQFLIFHCLAY